MKLHSDTLTNHDVMTCAAIARREHKQDLQVAELVITGSRKRAHGVSFKGYALTGRYATNSGIYGADNPRAATWSAWGYLIAELFQRDPRAVIGHYDGAEDFARQCREDHERISAHRPHELASHEIGFLDVLSAEVVS